jgi:hypothetical protein
LPPVFFSKWATLGRLAIEVGALAQNKKLGPACSCKFNMFELIFLSPRITPVAKILLDGLLTNAKLRVGKEFYLVIPVWDGVFERVVNCNDCFLKYFLFKNILK